ncbi:unnamed protein product [Lampetra planeri]
MIATMTARMTDTARATRHSRARPPVRVLASSVRAAGRETKRASTRRAGGGGGGEGGGGGGTGRWSWEEERLNVGNFECEFGTRATLSEPKVQCPVGGLLAQHNNPRRKATQPLIREMDWSPARGC